MSPQSSTAKHLGILTLITAALVLLTLIIQMRSQTQCKIYLNSLSNYLQIPSLLQSTRYLSTLWEALLIPIQTLKWKSEKPSNTFWTLRSTVHETPSSKLENKPEGWPHGSARLSPELCLSTLPFWVQKVWISAIACPTATCYCFQWLE